MKQATARDNRPLAGALRATAVAVLALLAGGACGDEGGSAGAAPGAGLTQDLLGAREREVASQNAPSLVRGVPIEELGFEFGSTGAPVRVLEMSDFGCGYCRRFHLETWPALHEEFVESGRVQWKLVPYVTGMFDNSMAVTRAAECALEQSPAAFEALTDRVWQDQAEWKASGEARDLLRGWAEAAGVEGETYEDCLASGRRMDRIEAGGQLARDLGVRGTPTFFVIGYGPLQGALPLDMFRQVLRSVLEREGV